jgi:hypothetical protein
MSRNQIIKHIVWWKFTKSQDNNMTANRISKVDIKEKTEMESDFNISIVIYNILTHWNIFWRDGWTKKENHLKII